MNSGWRLGRRPGLDGLRGLAIALVVANHAGFLYAPAGLVGVAAFFVLSGFLITRVIVEAREAGHWSFGWFFGNRVARLAPALTACVVVVSMWWVAAGRPATVMLGYAAMALTYVGDFTYPAMFGTILGHTWSLAVEEQFYLLWPFALGVLVVRRSRAVWIGGAVVASVMLRVALWGPHPLTSIASLPTNAYALLLGCGLALVAPRFRRAPVVLEVAALVVLGVVVWLTPWLQAGPAVAPVAGALLTVGLVWAAVTRPWLLTFGPLRFLGRISYALYLWHRPLLWMNGDRPGLVELPVVAAAIGLATLSTLCMEEPVRRWWRARQVSGAAPSWAVTRVEDSAVW